MIARLLNGEVLLTTRIGNILHRFGQPVVTGNHALSRSKRKIPQYIVIEFKGDTHLWRVISCQPERIHRPRRIGPK